MFVFSLLYKPRDINSLIDSHDNCDPVAVISTSKIFVLLLVSCFYHSVIWPIGTVQQLRIRLRCYTKVSQIYLGIQKGLIIEQTVIVLL